MQKPLKGGFDITAAKSAPQRDAVFSSRRSHVSIIRFSKRIASVLWIGLTPVRYARSVSLRSPELATGPGDGAGAAAGRAGPQLTSP